MLTCSMSDMTPADHPAGTIGRTEVAAILGVSVGTVDALAAAGGLLVAYRSPGGHRYYDQRAVETRGRGTVNASTLAVRQEMRDALVARYCTGQPDTCPIHQEAPRD